MLVAPRCSVGALSCEVARYTVTVACGGRRVHASLSVMRGCPTTERGAARAERKGDTKTSVQLLLKGKNFFGHCLATCRAARREWIKCKCSGEDQ